MLTIITGKAGTGKTAAVMDSVRQRVDTRARSLLIVPEQYSHEAERELCAACGPAMSLYAEVMSFTGLARRVDQLLGSGEGTMLDKGGRLLCMSLTLSRLFPELQLYGDARKRVTLQTQLLEAVTELKTACISSEQLLLASAACEGLLADKLHDLALILEFYDAVVSNGHADPTDRLTRLAGRIAEAGLEHTHIYIDGFTDFTRQQLAVITELLDAGCDLTVCLTCDPKDANNEVFAIPLATFRLLRREAEQRGVMCRTEHHVSQTPDAPLTYYGNHLFTYARHDPINAGGRVRLFSGDTPADECELAAAACLALVRTTGCRWRDISIAVRGFEGYETLLDSTFRKYGVPLYLTKKSDLLEKPLPSLIASAYDVITGGWDADDVFAYLRTGLAGLSAEECDLLENYVLLWDLRGTAWTRDADWRLHPGGYADCYTDEELEALSAINTLRRRAAGPLAALAKAERSAQSCREHIAALWTLLDTLAVPDTLESQAGALESAGYPQQAAECEQLWDITVTAMEQFDGLLGDTEMDTETFARLFALMLSQYDIGTIPISVDRVAAGEMDRMRRRNIRHLIVLGACDANLPRQEEAAGVFSPEDRARLLEIGLDFGTCAEAELWREFSLIYHCLTLPKDSLILSYAQSGGNLPSIVMNRAKLLFGLPVLPIDTALCKCQARDSALELAAFSLQAGGGPAAQAAAVYFSQTEPDLLRQLRDAAVQSRGQLSRRAVQELYGDKLRLSPSRIDQFVSCRFSYFMQYTLGAKPRQPAAFSPPEMGTFIHYVLERVAGQVMDCGGFRQVSDELLHQFTDRAIARYVTEFLNDFREKSPRFIYLFRRLTRDVRAVVDDMAGELRRSRFEPLSFELNFGADPRIPPMELGGGEDELILTGVADRVDGWVHDNKLYLRVVDYKTGKKEFSLSDVWYGMGLQMLLYLFTLEKCGETLYGMEVAPAGVLYVPAFDKNVLSASDLSDEEIAQKKAKVHLRSGLILNDDAVIAAMEEGTEYQYIPVSVKKRGSSAPDALVSAEDLGVIARHIDDTLRQLAGELRAGSICADPYYKSQQKNACAYCDYADACYFQEGRHGDKRRYLRSLPADQVISQMKGVLPRV